MTLPHPLQGKIIVITRLRERIGALAEAVESRGATVIPFPVLEFLEDEDPGCGEALRDLDSLDWLLFSSATAVAFYAERARREGVEPFPDRIALGAIGRATAAALAAAAGRAPDLVSAVSTAEGFGEAFLRVEPRASRRILLPSARRGRPELEDALASAGHRPERLVVYESVARPLESLPRLPDEGVDFVVFSSPSAVDSFLRLRPFPPRATAIAIGPTTARAARAQGLSPLRVAVEPTPEGLLAALLGAGEETQP